MQTTQAKELPVENLTANPWQPRKFFNPNKLIELALDIKQNGLIQPVVVRRDLTATGMYQIAAGERRWRAFKMLAEGFTYEGAAETDEDDNIVLGTAMPDRVGVKITVASDPAFRNIPVLVRTLTDEEMMRVALSENGKRSDVSPMEEAMAFRSMMADLGDITQSDFAAKMGVKQPTIANRLRLLRLPEAVQTLILEGRLGQFAGIKLLGWMDKYELPAKYVELAAVAWSEGKEADIKQLDYGVASVHRIPGVTLMNSYNVKFDVSEHCEGCPFHFVATNYGITHYCANPTHLEELNSTVPQKIAEERNSIILAHKEKVLAEFGVDVLRLSDGTPLQETPAKDEQGHPIIEWETARSLRMGNQFMDFTDKSYNGFSTAECQTCEFFVTVKSNEKEGKACLKPSHYQKLFAEHAKTLAEKRDEEARNRAVEFNVQYANLMLSGSGLLDAPTARFVARQVLSLMYERTYYEAILQEKVKAWLERRNLSTATEKIKYFDVPVVWIDEELVRVSLLSNMMFMDVVLMAVALVTEMSLEWGKFNDSFNLEVNTYTTQALTSIQEGEK